MDPNRLRVKYTIKLENQHIMGLFAGAFLVLGLFFSLGVMIGGRISKETAPAAQEDLVARIERQEGAYNVAVAGAPPVPAADAAAAAVPDGAATAAMDKPADQPGDKIPETASAPDPAKAAADKKTEAKPAEAAPAADGQSVLAGKVEAEKAAAAEAQKKQAQAKAAAAAEAKRFTLQVHAFKVKDQAQSAVKKFRPFDSRSMFIQEGRDSVNEVWYRVCIGEFANRDQANAYMHVFASKTGEAPIVSQLN